jgi:hypothetical protein
MAAVKILKASNDFKTGIKRIKIEIILSHNEFINVHNLLKFIFKKISH